MKNKKYTKDEALAKIKVLMSQFYEDIGREEYEDVEAKRIELILEIDEILSKTDISSKHLIIERFKLDEEENQRFPPEEKE